MTTFKLPRKLKNAVAASALVERIPNAAQLSKAKKFFTYILVSSISNEPFYVGKGCGTRDYDHERYARAGLSTFVCNKIRKIWREGGTVIHYYPFEDEYVAELEAVSMEIRLIKHYGRCDLNTGTLANLTDGGEGARTITESTRKKLKRCSSGFWNSMSEKDRAAFILDRGKLWKDWFDNLSDDEYEEYCSVRRELKLKHWSDPSFRKSAIAAMKVGQRIFMESDKYAAYLENKRTSALQQKADLRAHPKKQAEYNKKCSNGWKAKIEAMTKSELEKFKQDKAKAARASNAIQKASLPLRLEEKRLARARAEKLAAKVGYNIPSEYNGRTMAWGWNDLHDWIKDTYCRQSA